MAKASVGEQVQVDISGLEAPGVSIGAGVLATGRIDAVDLQKGEITVRLDLSFDDKDLVTVPVDRVKLISSGPASAGVVQAH